MQRRFLLFRLRFLQFIYQIQSNAKHFYSAFQRIYALMLPALHSVTAEREVHIFKLLRLLYPNAITTKI